MNTDVAIFGGGCFWCTEAVFKMLKGVISVEPGYIGGQTVDPTYEEVCTGSTGHAEAIRIEYDPELIAYRDLMTVFFGSHDATQLNRQGNDVGTQYRSSIFPTTPEQERQAHDFIEMLNMSSEGGEPIVTTVEPDQQFYPAEGYHKDYYARNSGAGYCQVVIAPKLEKVQKEYAELLARQ